MLTGVRMRTTLGTLTLALLIGLVAPAAGRGADLAAAQTAFAAGHYAAAAKILEAAYAGGVRNASCCLAAATAWRLAGQRGRTVLWLSRAARLDPGNPRVRGALAAADVAMPGRLLPLAGRFSPNALVWLALAGNAVFWVGLTLVHRSGRRLPRTVLILGALVVGWLWLEAGTSVLTPRLHRRGVIVTPLPARSAPEAAAETLFTLPPGRIVALGPRRDGYRQVADGPDRLGWLPEQGVVDMLP